MNRLLAINGGQQLKADDWAFLQNATAETFKKLVEGLKGATGPCIVTGLIVVTDQEEELITISEGVLFDGEELCYVPAAEFPLYDEEEGRGEQGPQGIISFKPNITTGESRVFKDTTSHDVYQYRRYTAEIWSDVPEGNIEQPDRLQDIMTWYVISQIEFPPAPPTPLVKLLTLSSSVVSLNQYKTLVPAPGSGYAVKVLAVSAKLTHTVTVNAGSQTLNVFYGTDKTENVIGTFPNSFIESPQTCMNDLEPSPGPMVENRAINVQLSSGAQPDEGSATIKLYCYYVIIQL